jgi:hypothetical protein
MARFPPAWRGPPHDRPAQPDPPDPQAVAHRVLQAEGDVARDGLRTNDGREFCVGDEVVARRPARDLHAQGAPRDYVRNGSRGRVVAVTESGLTVEFETLGRIDIPRSFIEDHPDRRGRSAPGLDYGYALTSYAVQGATLPASSSAVTAGARRRELYVNLTRGRHDNHLFIASPSDTLGGEGHLPRPPEDDVVAEVLAAVGRPDEDRSALEIDPLALDVAEVRAGRTAAELRALLDAADGKDKHALAVARRAGQVAANAAARAAVAEPPAWVHAVLPARPDVPWLAARWDAAVGAVAAYRARWEPAPIPGGSITGRLLGSPGSEAQGAERSEALWLVGDVWAGVAQRMLADHARTTETLSPEQRSLLLSPPPWLRRHLRELGAAGALADGVPVTSLTALYVDVAAYRSRWRSDAAGDEERDIRSLLGERPDEPLAQRQWEVLAHRTTEVGRGRAARARAR